MPTYLVTFVCGHTDWAASKPADGSATTCPIDGPTTVRTSERWTP